MTNTRSQPGLLNLDVLALSLLCCLLASVVGVLVLSGEEKAIALENQRENPEIWIDLRQQTSQLRARVQEGERSRGDIVNKINHSVLARENRTLESRIKEFEEKITLINRLGAAKAESSRLAKELEEKERARNAPLTPEARRMLGEYKGPYVLIECIEDAAIIYPGKERIEMKPSTEQLEQLLDKISKAGFVAFVVRPDGWYDNSYDKLKALIYQRLEKREKDTGKSVGRSTFPLGASAPIDNYLPPER